MASSRQIEIHGTGSLHQLHCNERLEDFEVKKVERAPQAAPDEHALEQGFVLVPQQQLDHDRGIHHDQRRSRSSRMIAAAEKSPVTGARRRSRSIISSGVGTSASCRIWRSR